MQHTDPLIGQQVDEYLIEDLLGHGGMGRVYRGLDVKLNRYTAIKVMSMPDKSKASTYQKRFFREAQAIAKLHHNNIVTIYRYNEVNDIYYMAMQYIDGADLRWVLSDYVRHGDLIDYGTLMAIMEQICKALDFAHKNGVIHRDIKPSNIMIARDGTAILTDFGLALDVQQGTGGEIFGSPHYIAPEQAVSSAQAVPQTDLYALGVILYEMLTGSVPYESGSAMQIAMAHISDPLPEPKSINPDLHDAFIPVLYKILEKTPADRYQNGASLVRALKKAIKKAQQEDSAPEITSPGRPRDRIANNIRPLVDPKTQTKPMTRIAPDSADEVATKIYSEPAMPDTKKSRRNFAGYYAFMIIAFLALAFVLYQDKDTLFNQLPFDFAGGANTEVINAHVEGQVSSIDIQRNDIRLVIYSETIAIPRTTVLYDAIEALAESDSVREIRIEGHYALRDGVLHFDHVTTAWLNDSEIDLETEE